MPKKEKSKSKIFKKTVATGDSKSQIAKKTVATGALFATIISLASIFYNKHVKAKTIQELTEWMEAGLNKKIFLKKICDENHNSSQFIIDGNEYKCVYDIEDGVWVLDIGDGKVAKIFGHNSGPKYDLEIKKIQKIQEIQKNLKLEKFQEFVTYFDCKKDKAKISYQSFNSDVPYIIMENIPGTLLDVFFTQTIDKKNMMVIILMVLLLIQKLCESKLIITDIKLANIFWREKKEKIEFGFLDFGIASDNPTNNCTDIAVNAIKTMLEDMKSLRKTKQELRLSQSKLDHLESNQKVFEESFNQVCNVYKSNLWSMKKK